MFPNPKPQVEMKIKFITHHFHLKLSPKGPEYAFVRIGLKNASLIIKSAKVKSVIVMMTVAH